MFKNLFKKKPDDPVFRLMTFESSCDPVSAETSFGGQPVVNDGEEFTWPACESCKGNMQYLGKIRDGEHLSLIFMCQNDPGLCDEWESDGGGNRAIRFRPTTLAVVSPPQTGEVLRQTEYGSRVTDFSGQDYHEARSNWAKKNGQSPRMVLGFLGGVPDWLQADETPCCNACSSKMRFVAQLDEGPDHRTEMNFGGGGCAYLFACDDCNEVKFLWQC